MQFKKSRLVRKIHIEQNIEILNKNRICTCLTPHFILILALTQYEIPILHNEKSIGRKGQAPGIL